MTSANVKANVKQEEIKELTVVFYKFLQEVPSKLEIQCKKGVSFSLNLGWCFIQFDIIH